MSANITSDQGSPAPWVSSATGIAWGTIALFVFILLGYAWLIPAAVNASAPLPLLMLASTVLLYLSFTVVHEAGHGNIAHDVAAMKPVERIIGWIGVTPFLVIPFGLFAKIHDLHHAFTNDPERDPDYWVSGQKPHEAMLRAFGLAFKYILLTTGPFLRHPAMASTHKSSLIFYTFTFSLVVAIIYAGHIETLLWVAVVPMFLASFVLAMLFDWIPHMPTKQQARYQNTRVYLFPGLNILTLGQSYHLIHHLYPRVSWYHYKRVFNAMRAELEQKEAPIETLFSRKGKGFLAAPEAARPATRDHSHKLTLNVTGIDHDTPDSVVISFETLSSPLPFKAGQYITVTRMIEGEALTRCYSICSTPASGKLQIGVRQVGRMSGFLNHHLTVGEPLTIAGPFGEFVYESANGMPLTLLAGGSGITPVLSILQSALDQASATPVHLIYANRSIVNTMFLRQLNALALKHPSRLKIDYVFEEGHGGWNGLTGRLDSLTLAHLIDQTPDSTQGRFYICGPGPLKQMAVDTLKALSVSEKNIHVEEFVTSAPAPEGPVHRVEVFLANGAHHQIDVAENQTVLQAATRQGVHLPHACGVGQCGCCMMRIQEGQSVLASDETPGLLPGERAQGLTLACQCMPRSAMIINEGIHS